MKRSARHQAESASSLFPFLAVLLCTMGALIVLLVTLAQVSRQRAIDKAEQAVAEAPPQAEEVAEAKASLAFLEARMQEAAEWRAGADERLAEQKARLAGVNDHIRRLQEEAEVLVAEMQELLLQEEEHYDDEQMAQAELERLQEQQLQLQQEIRELESTTVSRDRVALIPPLVDGAGTRRPPVYFECFANKVVLQPEGVEFSVADTLAAKHSSPFAAAVGAVVQYYLDNPSAFAAGESGDPYPLVVTKPEGVMTMLSVIRAFDATGITYGYETVPEDWDLDYGTANPVLAKRIEQAIQVARAERSVLAEYAPQLFRGRSSGMVLSEQAKDSSGATYVAVDGGGGGFQEDGPGAGSEAAGDLDAYAATQPALDPDAPVGPGGSAAQGDLMPSDAQPTTTTMVRIENLQATEAAAKRLNSAGGKRRGLTLVRPIRLQLHADHAVILPSEDDRGVSPTRIDCPDGVLNHAEDIIAALADHAETWGDAGDGMRWSPQVQVTSAAGQTNLERPVLHLLRMFGVSTKSTSRIATEQRTQR